jgi:O-antigen/teichoic acid export membrane protein
VSTSSLLKTSLSAHLGTSGIQLLYRMDMVVLALFVSRSELGIYSIAVPIASITWVVSEAISLAAFSTFRPEESPEDRMHRLVALLRLNLVVGAAGSVCVLAVSWVGLDRYLPHYHDAFRLIAILLPGVVVQGGARILYSQITSVGASRAAVTIGLASFALCLLYFPFCARWGATGAALASSLIYILQAIVVVACARRLFVGQVARSAV